MEEEIFEKKKFFEAIKSNNVAEVSKIFKTQNSRPWEFIENEGNTGLHLSVYLDFPILVIQMIELMRLSLVMSNQPLSILKDWINKKSDQGFTAIHYASYRGNLKIIQKLIENDADIYTLNNQSLNVLHMAAQGNQPISIVYFVENYSMDLFCIDNSGSTPLHWASFSGSEDALNYLIYYKVDLNVRDNQGLTPLHLAVFSDRSRIVRKLLQNGAKKEVRDNKNRTVVDAAFEKNKRNIIEMLTQKSPCSFITFSTPIEKSEKNYTNIIIFYSLFSVINLIMFFIILPYLKGFAPNFFFCLINLLVLLNYHFLIFSDPGTIHKMKHLTLKKLLVQNVRISDYCPDCLVKKKLTSKHCLICNICVDEFDHHCYWVSNCVGKKNFKYFILLLNVVSVLLIFNFFMSYLSYQNKEYNHLSITLADDHSFFYKLKNILCLFVMLQSLVFFVPLALLLFSNMKGILTDYLKKRNENLTIVRDSKSTAFIENSEETFIQSEKNDFRYEKNFK